MISKEHIGSLYAILSGFLYGFIGYFGMNVMNASISASNMLFWRFLISSIIMVIFLFKQFNHIKQLRKEVFITFCNGAVFYAISTLFYFLACPYIGSGLAMVIFFTYPAMVILLNYFLYKQTIPSIYYYAIAIIMAGMPLFIDLQDMRFDVYGIFFSILSAVLYAAYLVSSKRVTQLSANVSTLMVCLGCTMTCLILSLFNHSFTVPSSLPIWLNLLGIGILSTAVPIALLLFSLNYISAEKASILSVLEPVFVLIFGITLLGEPMKLQYAVGSTIVLAGALLTLLSNRIELKLKWLGDKVKVGR